MSPLFSMTADELQHFLVTRVPHNEALGIKVRHCSAGKLGFELPYDPELVGNPATGEMHEGTLTVLLDGCCGSVPLTVMDVPRRTATLDLRIDFLRKAGPGLGVRCEAQIMSLDEHIATVTRVRDG